MMQKASSSAKANPAASRTAKVVVARRGPRVPQAADSSTMGFKTMRNGVKEAADETLLSPRFYTTDFEAMEELFDVRKNPNIRMDELEAACAEFANDYNQRHFVRNDTFKPAADKISGATRRIFIEFLERSCTAEFSGFLLYKEIGRRLKQSNPVVAEIFTLMSRDEARHAGFINKAMSDFNLALDLGFLTKNRKYTFFKPEFIIWATYLSEKIGYWRYISIYRHLQRNPDNQLYPLFEYFENWCQDESRHGDFLAACLKALPQFVEPSLATKLWCRFFCHSVYITMYLNDHSRTSFYESLGLNTRQFNQHVIIETNNSTERIFPEVPDVEHPSYFMRMDRLIELSDKLKAIDQGSLPAPLKVVAKAPVLERMVAEISQLFWGPVKRTGSYDLAEDPKALVY